MFGIWPIIIGITVVGWIAFAINRRRGGARDEEFRLMLGASLFASTVPWIEPYLGHVVPVLILAQAIWVRPVLANTFAGGVMALLQESETVGPPIPDVSNARHAYKTGRLEEAVGLVEAELAKDPNHYEGNYLLAQILWEQRQHLHSLGVLIRLRRCDALTAEQRKQVAEEIEQAQERARANGWIGRDLTQGQILEATAEWSKPRRAKTIHFGRRPPKEGDN